MRRVLKRIAAAPPEERDGALADFAVEHGERGLRELGGRHAAETLLAAQAPELEVPALLSVLEQARG